MIKTRKSAPSLASHVAVYGALLLLLLLTTALAYLNLGWMSLVIALTIAITKTVLVVCFFMEVRNDQPLTRVFTLTGVFWLLILISLALTDYGSRNWLSLPGSWPGRLPGPATRIIPASRDTGG